MLRKASRPLGVIPSCITHESYYLLVMFNVSEGGDPMSSEISVSGAGNGKGVFSTGQPSL